MSSRLTGLALAIALTMTALPSLPGVALAKVFYSRNEALDMAFPDAERVESETHVLADEQVARIERMAKGPLESKLVKIYTGFRGNEVVGYAVIDIHNVRTLPEAFMIVLDPDGTVRSLRMLAFHEPLDYMPAERWYAQFEARSLEEPLRVGGDVHGIVGATLSARATARGVRRALAFYEVLVQNGH
jgi:Na+-translocating ferredoxin:NAD+ oxidoreductase RnfG subunit